MAHYSLEYLGNDKRRYYYSNYGVFAHLVSLLRGDGWNFDQKGLVSSVLNKVTAAGLTGAQVEQNQYAHDEAQLQRDYEERMANTSYQRTVSDLQAAGLNPALAYGNAVDPTPSGASASSTSIGHGSTLLDLILQMKSLSIQEKLANAEVGLKGAETKKKEAEIPWIDRLNKITEERGLVDIQNARQQKKNLEADYDLKINQAKTEEERALLVKAQKAVQEATEKQISVMLDYDRLYVEAKTETEKAQCNLAKLQYMYDQKLWNDEYIDSIRKYAVEHAGNEEYVKEINKASKDILSGNWIDTKDMTPGEKFLAKILNLFMATNSAVKK